MITQEKAEIIAQCFAETNFLNKSLALRKAGYSPKYAKGIGQKLLDNIRVKAEIEKIKAKLAEKCEITEEYILNGMKYHADNKKDAPALSLRAFTELGHIKGLYAVDNAQKQPQTANIVFIDGTRTAKQVESMLIEKQAGMGNAICDG